MRRTILSTPRMQACLDFDTGYPMLHMELPMGITPSLYKYIKNVFIEDLLITLGSLGYETIFAVLEEENKTGIKSAKLIGFEEEKTVDGFTWLVQEIA